MFRVRSSTNSRKLCHPIAANQNIPLTRKLIRSAAPQDDPLFRCIVTGVPRGLTDNWPLSVSGYSTGRWEGEMLVAIIRLRDPDGQNPHGDSPSGSLYLRVRGTNTTELEPEEDTRGEDPWTDLWCYSNPIFVEVD